MSAYNLMPKEEELIKWLVQEYHAGNLEPEFSIIWISRGYHLNGYKGDKDNTPEITNL